MTKSKDRQAFDKAMAALIQVPKTELAKAERDYKKARKAKRRRKRK